MNLKSTFLAVVSTLLIASCATDPCKDITCLNDGTCSDGTCLCTDWYEGTDCGAEQRTKFFGTYAGTLVSSLPDGTTDTQTLSFVISASSEGVNYLNLDGIKSYLTTNNSGDITVPLQEIPDPDGNFFVQGTGSFSGSQFILNYTIDVQGITVTANFTGTK